MKFRLSLLAAVYLFLVAGCEDPASRMVSARGKVTFQGRALKGGTVVFTPDESRGAGGPMAHARIQNDGAYTLQTDEGVGAYPGWYRVTIAAGASVIPEKYRDPELSGLSCELQPGKENVINFNLE